MNTNPDAFENDLRALKRRALPEGWRNEMLQRAKPAIRTPRWLVAGWSVAWAAILAMYFTMPTESATQRSPAMSNTAPTMLWQQRAATIEALLAAN
ncbi:MAG: hypothetical protein ACKVY0_25785 [Prosthecobacter sp.]|uniref:hypothetical protein n=1 Tax=Prosthecobacter sp. TaxID=1965333 RepID=UPI00390092F5